MKRIEQTSETLIGAIVAAVAIGFVWYAVSRTGQADASAGYPLTARFNRVDGVAVGTDVRLSGVKVGTVDSVAVEPAPSFFAKVNLSVRSDIKLPSDTAARVQSDGLLGGAYISLEPGGAEEMLKAGGEIENTQGAVDLLTLFSSALSGSNKDDSETTP